MAIVALDNGGGNLKAGFAGQPAPVKCFPNCTAKAKGERQGLVGDMLVDAKEVSQLSLRRPFDRGYLVNWELEREIWGRLFKNVLRINPRECGLLMTEPLFNFPVLQAATEQVVFEEFGFRAYHAAPAPFFSLRRAASLVPGLAASQALTGVVVDAGFSFTHVVPFFNGQVLMGGVKRINIGGKAMTNYLKELVSYRSLNMMDEPYLMELIKEQLSFVSKDIRTDLKVAQAGLRSPHRREYVLPDGVHHLRGYVRDHEARMRRIAEHKAAMAALPPDQRRPLDLGEEGQVLVLNNERFTVPELLFNPQDIGLAQAGVAEAVVQAVTSTHPALAPLLFSNVVLTGGVAACPGFRERFEAELRPQVLDDYDVNVFTPPDPVLCAWEGMSMFGASQQYMSVAMTKQQYDESGASAARQYS